MVRAGSSSEVSRSASGFAWMLPAVAIAVCTVIAVSVVSSGARAPVAICGAAATVAVVLVAAESARRGRALIELRARFAEQDVALKRRLSQQEADHRTAGRVCCFPRRWTRLQQGRVRRGRAHVAATTGTPTVATDRRVPGGAPGRADVRARRRGRGGGPARLRAARLRQRRPPRPGDRPPTGPGPAGDGGPARPRAREVFGDLLRLDHGTALIGRLADTHRRARRCAPRPPVAQAGAAVQRAARRDVAGSSTTSGSNCTRSPRSPSSGPPSNRSSTRWPNCWTTPPATRRRTPGST